MGKKVRNVGSLAEAKGELTTDTADLKITENALVDDTTALEDDFEASTPRVGLRSWRRLQGADRDLREDRRR